ncbi:hydrogenase large subunit [Leptospira santarosai]|uniref:Metal (Ni/Fe) hydrogenase large subunit n=1 Tax=Leptospira santarosai TaxID=28183 RepID=A0AB73N0U0_9LEPT|nr:metal (Ni/Fe) hydrogenase large subunit [Leptospira santarosai]MDI7165904.1 metal (Ni/Fe) hydrogenase large subunit [Leptospira santarosai]MDI7174110.1 metal (Ni/Fe) hydrogenase large subunit [Leptospira santarosai]MDI7193381.1 metal (Ni/Fe) hydrogenase large subunit [Leptospira santarosai]MDO6381247.1 metal (Ni/Fe) hydrogenase large subunit [Leptospira santarosai]MDO6393859.1 metal (Ni/Fe) hydrogenase large subunit [Leptospira santarosai]
MRSVTGLYPRKGKKGYNRFWLTGDGVEHEVVEYSEKEAFEDTANPIWILRHSLGIDQGEEDYSSYDFERYVTADRKTDLEKFVTKKGIKDLVYKGLKVPIPASHYSHAVGPIHAGVIEPGHFRFIVKGEEIRNLDIRLGFQKRGLIDLIKGKGSRDSLPYAEAISGDSTIAYAIAFSRIFEEAQKIAVPQEVDFARLVLLELERIATHIGDMGAIAGDIGYYPLQGVCSLQRGIPLGVMETLTGNRFGRGALSPGKVVLRKRLDREKLNELAERIRSVTADVGAHFERAANVSTNRERLQSCGIIRQKQVRHLGFIGMAEKCTGLSRDLRSLEKSYLFSSPISLELNRDHMKGDAWARFYLRYEELKNSGKWLADAIPKLEAVLSLKFGKVSSRFTVKKGTYYSAVEGWRGPVLVSLDLDAVGSIENAYIREVSVPNWHALELAVRGEYIGDFPLNNKSFNLSYVGVDL